MSDQGDELVPPANASSSSSSTARGYGLNEEQQKAIADLWSWQEQSLRSKIILGGPLA
jgi:hypothetical protein